MGVFKAMWMGAGLSALMMVMSGCDSGERIQDPSAAVGPVIGAVGTDDSSAFDRELIQAKVGNADAALRDRAIMNVFDKYGVAYPRDHAPAGPVQGEKADGAFRHGTAAAKTSFNASSFQPVRRDLTKSGDVTTFRRTFTLQNGQKLGAIAIGNTANVDPFMVLYYSHGGSPIPAYQVVTLATFNDDASAANRHSIISWTNNTGIAQIVVVQAFAYSTASRGLGRIMVNTSTSSENFSDQPIGGLMQFGAIPLPPEPSNCSFLYTEMSLNTAGANVGFSALVMDTQHMKGGLIQDRNNNKGLAWRVDTPYPSFALLYGPGTGSARLIQTDIYSCLN